MSINKTSSCGGQGLDCKFQVINFKKGWSFGLIKLSSCPAPGLHVSQQLDSKFQEGKSIFIKGVFWASLKVPKREIFDRSDFPNFYTIKSSWVGDLLVKILTYYFNF